MFINHDITVLPSLQKSTTNVGDYSIKATCAISRPTC